MVGTNANFLPAENKASRKASSSAVSTIVFNVMEPVITKALSRCLRCGDPVNCPLGNRANPWPALFQGRTPYPSPCRSTTDLFRHRITCKASLTCSICFGRIQKAFRAAVHVLIRRNAPVKYWMLGPTAQMPASPDKITVFLRFRQPDYSRLLPDCLTERSACGCALLSPAIPSFCR